MSKIFRLSKEPHESIPSLALVHDLSKTKQGPLDFKFNLILKEGEEVRISEPDHLSFEG